MTSFDLTHEPWISVLDSDGHRRELSITELFHQAEDLREIVGEVPTQGFAILRLLLAVLHRAVDGPKDVDDWVAIRDGWKQTVGDVEHYLVENRQRFDLRHTEAPFFQVAGLSTQKGDVAGLEKLIADVPNGNPFFTTRIGRGVALVSWAEAARWLVHVHAFDPSGLRPGAKGDPRRLNPNGTHPPIGTGWAGMLGGVFLRGRTVQETLLLNLVAPDEAGLELRGEDLPVWERHPQGPGPEGGLDGRQPTGPVDLYTWQSRRVRLVGDDAGVTGAVLTQGDRMTPQNRHRLEPLTAWRFSKPQTAKFKQDTYMPREHDPARAMWRGLPGLLAGQDERTGIEPGVLRWASALELDGHLPAGTITVQAVGIEYGPQSSTVGELVHDHLDLPAEIVAHGDRSAAHLASRAVDQARLAVNIVATLAQNLYLAAGGDTESDGPATRARESAYDQLEGAFRRWVLTLSPDADVVERETAWQVKAHAVISRVGRDLAEAAGPAAMVGRTVRGRHLDLGLAEAWFRSGLRKTLPLSTLPADTQADADNEEPHHE